MRRCGRGRLIAPPVPICEISASLLKGRTQRCTDLSGPHSKMDRLHFCAMGTLRGGVRSFLSHSRTMWPWLLSPGSWSGWSCGRYPAGTAGSWGRRSRLRLREAHKPRCQQRDPRPPNHFLGRVLVPDQPLQSFAISRRSKSARSFSSAQTRKFAPICESSIHLWNIGVVRFLITDAGRHVVGD
jgi:hypothetical protein